MKLVKSNMGHYVWLYGPGEISQKFCGGLLSAMHYGISHLEIPREEVIMGVAEATKQNHDIIEFGDINGLFIFSRKGSV